jgi:drug/metabolite transporter (DMT)-like permease
MKARIAILCCTLLWGCSFVVLKDLTVNLPFGIILVVRFLLAAVVLLPVVIVRRARLFERNCVMGGVIVGLCLFVAYYFQTTGLMQTTPGKNAFITAIYCVIVPFYIWIFDKKKPSIYTVIALCCAVVGLGLVSLSGNFSINVGDALTLVCAFFFAGQIYFVARYGTDSDLFCFTFWQFLTAGVCFFIYSVIDGEHLDFASLSLAQYGALAYLLFGATLACILLQNYGQRNLPAASSGLLLTTESVFGAGISVALGYEALTAPIFCGFCLIFVAMVISEAGPELYLKIKQRFLHA